MGPKAPEQDRPNKDAAGQKLLWYPAAETVPGVKMPTRGKYAKGYPQGAIVHFTSGWSRQGDAKAINAVRSGAKDGYCFFVISYDGSVFQNFPLDSWGYHAGKSSWPGLGTSVSSKLVGIEICNGSKLKKRSDGRYESWFGEIFDAKDVRVVKSKDNVKGGAYQPYSEAQEASLMALLLWLKRNNPGVFDLKYVLGHDEVAPDRKDDPGGALSMTMPEYRAKLQKLYNG